ncbi:MAG: sigma-70 family RNA polymerase sigma factor [Flavobacteriaceae bacterium]
MTKTKHYHHRTQEEILSGLLLNNDLVINQLYREVFPKVQRYIFKNNGTSEQAKDIFQEAFAATWKNAKKGKLGEAKGLNVEAYLYTIAKNKWLDHLRSSAYKKTVRTIKLIDQANLSEESENETETSESQFEMEAMRAALKSLGENCKSLLNLFYFERKSMDEIAIELNIGAASARNQKYRCMEKLRGLALELKNNGK